VSEGTPEQRARAAACGHFVEALYGSCGPSLPAAEWQRRRQAYADDCVARFTMPGNGSTPSSLEACARALEDSSCEKRSPLPSACDLRGTFVSGVACFTFEQCASGFCAPAMASSGASCGHCTDVIASGDPCPEGGCAPGSVCVGAPPDARVCKPRRDVGAGQACDESANRCTPGLHCDASGHCEPALQDGQACSNEGEPPCLSHSFCSAEGVCTPGAGEGDACAGDHSCGQGLVCASNPQSCEPPLWRQGVSAHRGCRCGL
jgi:hypothetical protein